MRINALGALELVDGSGNPVVVGAAKERAVLWALALTPNQLVSTDRLIEAVWGEEPPPSAVTTVRSLVSRLRASLGGASQIERRATGYVLAVSAGELDSLEFEALAAEATAARPFDPAAAALLLRRALGLWRGPAFSEVADKGWARSAAARLEVGRLVALEDLYEAELAAGRHRAVLAELEETSRTHFLRERFFELWMLALYRSGQQAEALAACQELRGHLLEELGLDPSPAVVRLEQLILQQDEALLAGSGSGDLTNGPRRRPAARAVACARVDAAREQPSAREILDVVALAFAAAGGRMVSSSGARELAVFDSFATAVAACASVVDGDGPVGRRRRASGAGVAATDEGEGGPGAPKLEVACGVAEGEAVILGDELVGLVLHQAVAVAEAANPGQVLVCRPLGDDDLDGLATVPVGTFRLPDFKAAVALHRVMAPGVPDSALGPRAPDALAERLPLWPFPLVGREDELRRLAELGDDVPVLSIVGPGGCGKTRMAVELARRCAARFAGDVWFVDLAATGAGSEVVYAVAKRLDVSLTSAEPLEELVASLAARRTLVVLDNCEHVIDAAAEVADAISRQAAQVRLIATSREPLDVLAETVWHLDPLRLPAAGASVAEAMSAPSVRLLLERIRAKDPRFAASDDFVEAAAELVRSVDGLPLAIELAAARAGREGSAALRPLDDRLRALRGHRGALRRQASLEATIAWSHDLLDDEERMLFRRLSVFKGGFDRQASLAVCGHVGDVSQLVDKSLVLTTTGPSGNRYRFYEVVGDFAAERLAEAGEEEATHRRHLDFFRSLTEAHRSSARSDVEALDGDYPNLRAAMSFALSLGGFEALGLAAGLNYYWQVRGLWSEGRDWLSRALSLSGGSESDRVMCLLGRATFAVVTGHGKLAELDARAALELDLDPLHRARSLRLLAGALTRQVDYEAAWPIWMEARAEAQAAGDTVGEADALRGLGSCAYLLGRFEESAALSSKGLDLANRSGAEGLAGSIMNNLGQALSQTGDYGRAQEILEESLRQRRELGFARGEASVLNSLAENALRLGDPREAVSLARGAYQLFVDLDDQDAFLAAGTLALGLLEEGRPEAALELLGAIGDADTGVADHELSRFREAEERASAALEPGVGDVVLARGRRAGVRAVVAWLG